jgi:hypothetical protein
LILELRPAALVRAIILLSHAGLHPDIFWTPDNWIPEPIKRAIQPTYRWSPEEIAQMIRVIDHDDWGRGTRGQCLDVLFYEDKSIVPKVRMAIGLLLADSDLTQAVRAASLALTQSRNQRRELRRLIRTYPALTSDAWFRDIAASVEEEGFLPRRGAAWKGRMHAPYRHLQSQEGKATRNPVNRSSLEGHCSVTTVSPTALSPTSRRCSCRHKRGTAHTFLHTEMLVCQCSF